MDEYISKETTVKAFCEKCHSYYYYNGHCIHRDRCNVDVIQAVPAADVQPVKHGRWVWDSNAPHRDYGAYKCNNCGYHSDFEENYCPNCGCKQDLDGDSE